MTVRADVRLPDDLHAALEALAETNHRSLHGEILDRLWSSVNEEVEWHPGGQVAEVRRRVDVQAEPKSGADARPVEPAGSGVPTTTSSPRPAHVPAGKGFRGPDPK